jgi:signal transduction histidine kinase
MRSTIFILLAAFGIFADFTSRKIIEKNNIINQAKIISRAKKQWEVTVDSLPQLVIAIDYNARIIRINRTVETWGIGKVNKVDGLYALDFLKGLNDNYTDDAWTSDWPYIWQQIKNKGLVERKVVKKHMGKTYQYTLRKISDYDDNNDQCYAVLIIDDITARQSVETSLKGHAQELEKEVNSQTKELKHANSQLERELQAKKAANKELKESQICRLALLREIFTTQEKERKRIACGLHDSVGQSLGATKFKLEELLIDKQDIFNADYDEFTDVIKNLQSIIQEVRHISMDLRPAMLDDLGALVTLNWFCREFGNTYTGLSVKKIINVDESDISEDNKVVIFRIVQEAMNNIAKYAKATNIVLELSKSDSGMRMCISDNGVGFDMDLLKSKDCNALDDDFNHPKCSFGLSSMRERAESTNGKFLIESSPGSGTSVIVTWENKETPAFAHS